MTQESSVGETMRDILPSKHSAASLPSLPRHLPQSSPNLTSLTHSEGVLPLYASALVQESSVVDLPAQSDIIIAVMGPTGAGKSTFINKATGNEETEVGHGLESCTHAIQIVRCLDTQQNRRVVFVDTPGFNDINISDLDILQLVANWLKLTYENDIRLSGLLFFHRISDNRMGGSPLKYLKMFQNLCGNEALKNVVLVTTMWDEVGEEEGCHRETELSTKYWNTMLELGCHTSRFYNNTESAWDIISHFQDARCTLLLQKELVDMGLELAETSAGRTLFSSLIEFIKKIKEVIAHTEAKLKQNQSSMNRIVVEHRKMATEAAWREADAQRRRYSVSSSVFRRFRVSHFRPSTGVNARRTSIPDNNSNTKYVAATPRENASVSLTYSPTIESFSPSPSLAYACEAYSGTTALQGTITVLKLAQQIVGLAPVSGLQTLVGLVLNISEIVNNMYTTEVVLIELAQKAGSFMVTLVEEGPIRNLSDSNSVIQGLTKEMNRVLGIVRRISSQRMANRFFSAFDKAVIDECNRQIVLACGIFGIQIAFISQQAIARIEAKLNMALKLQMNNPIPPQSNQEATSGRQATAY